MEKVYILMILFPTSFSWDLERSFYNENPYTTDQEKS